MIAATAGTAYWGYSKVFGTSTGGDAAEPVAVRVEKAALGDLSETISASGILEPVNKVSISAKVSARILEIPYDEGDKVTAGNADTSPSVLLRLDAQDLAARLQSAQARYSAQEKALEATAARVESARSRVPALKAAYTEVERELRREKDLVDGKYSSSQVYEAAVRKVAEAKANLAAGEYSFTAEEANLVSAQHSLEAAKGEVIQAREDLDNATILAPIDGTVTQVNARPGEMVITGTMNNPGTVVLEVADLSQLLVKAELDETHILSVKAGQKASVLLQALEDRPLKGVVRRVSLTGKGGTGPNDKDDKKFTAEILMDPIDVQLPTGLSADVEVETSHHTGVLKIPTQAIVARPPEELPEKLRNKMTDAQKAQRLTIMAFRKNGDKAEAVPIEMGSSDMHHTVITSGLEEGDEVITGPFKALETLKHDQKIKPEIVETTATLSGTSETTSTK